MDSEKYSLDTHLKGRTVIPKWNTPKDAIETSIVNTKVLERRKASAQRWLQRLKSTNEQFPSPSAANEVYELSSMYGLPMDLNPLDMRSMLAHRSTFEKPPVLSTVSSMPLVEKEVPDVGAHKKLAWFEIQCLKQQIRKFGNTPFAWSELSRYYLVAGEPERADRAMTVALGLVKHNRYLERAATRLFVHLKEPDRALDLLKRNPALTSDPWLLAAEVATSSSLQRTSKFVDHAKRLLNTTSFSANQLSELAAAIGTLEIEHSATKKAKALFAQSLQAPTGNSLAQAQWAVSRDLKIIIPASAWSVPSHEAKALALHTQRDWQGAIRECIAWLAEEPYSNRASVMGSYFGLWPKLAHVAEQFASAGLTSFALNRDETNISLLNNRAVAKAFQNNPTEALADFEEAMKINGGQDNPHLMATLGLIAYRFGYHKIGRNQYIASIAWFNHNKEYSSAVMATLYYWREELRANPHKSKQAIAHAQKILAKSYSSKSPEIQGISELLISEAQTIQNYEAPVRLFEALPPDQSIFEQHDQKFSLPKNALTLLASNNDLSELFTV